MKTLVTALKSTLVGGVVFLLPIGIVIVVLGKLLVIATNAGNALHRQLFPGVDNTVLPLLLALIILIAIAFAAGVFARTALGGRTFAKLEGAVLARVPVYTVFRQTIGDMAGGSALMSSGEATKVVLVRLDDMTVIGFQIERRADGLTVVFLPGAPSALSGSVALVDHDRVTPTDLTPTDIMDRMRRLGSGLGAIAGGRAG